MKKTLLIAGLILGAAGSLRSDEPASLQDLDQRLRIAERKLELSAESGDAAKKADATVSAGSGGFTISSADKKYALKLGGLLQVDNRSYNGDVVLYGNDILIRRARLNTDATLGERVKLRLVAELSGASATLVDSYADLKIFEILSARVGRFKTPISLENFRSDPARDFAEAGFSLGLTTLRDTGLWLDLADADQAISLGAGVFSGGADGATVASTANFNTKDGVAKLFIHPLRFFDTLLLRDFGLGVAGSFGFRNPGTSPASYRSTGQLNAASYKSLTTHRQEKSRLAPQAYLFQGPYSLLGEYVRSIDYLANTTNVNADAPKNAWGGREAWQISAGWVITGEDASFNGPKWSKETTSSWGILQLVGRYQEFQFDDPSVSLQPAQGPDLAAGSAGQRFVNPRSSVRKIQGWGAGLNWLASPNVKFYLDWEENYFTDGNSGIVDGSLATTNRETERVLFTRAQFTY